MRVFQPDLETACYNFATLKPAGIYIHIPFCRSRCSYCDFATGMYDAAIAERYVKRGQMKSTRGGKLKKLA